MASPSDGRRSYARRTQYTAFVSYVVAIIGVIVGLLTAIIWVVDPVGFSNLRMVISEIVAPAQRVVSSGLSGASGADDSIAGWWRAGSQNAELRSALNRQRREIIHARALQAENRELRALLHLSRADPAPVAVARLLSSSATSTRRFAVLDAGFADGVRSGQPVRGADGLIGRTLEVGPSVSRVLLITDRESVVPGRRARDGLAVLVNGRGDNLLEVRPLNNVANALKVGDLIVASGSGGLYRGNTPVGIIIRLNGDDGLARPLAEPNATEGVIVEPAAAAALDEPPPEGTSIVPATPTPPTATTPSPTNAAATPTTRTSGTRR